MFSFFKSSKASAATGAWPKAAIVGVLQGRYASVSHVGDDEGFSLYGVSDNNLNFIVALVEVHGAPDQIVEVGFLTRFVGFELGQSNIEFINRNLHISVAGLENGDLIVVGGVQAAGVFDPASFSLILDTWRRDLVMVLQALQGGASIMAAFPAARSTLAQNFAINRAPKIHRDQDAAAPADLFKAYFWDGPGKTLCASCEGRGKLGFIARVCADCGGQGLIARRRASANR